MGAITAAYRTADRHELEPQSLNRTSEYGCNHDHVIHDPSPLLRPIAPALFLDRDGVINHEIGYLSNPEDSLCRCIVPLIATARALGFASSLLRISPVWRGTIRGRLPCLMEHMRATSTANRQLLRCLLRAITLSTGWKVPNANLFFVTLTWHALQAAADHSLDLASSVLWAIAVLTSLLSRSRVTVSLFALRYRITPCAAFPAILS